MKLNVKLSNKGSLTCKGLYTTLIVTGFYICGCFGVSMPIIEGVRARVGQLTKLSIFSLVCICVTLILTLPAAKLHHAEWKIELSAIT